MLPVDGDKLKMWLEEEWRCQRCPMPIPPH